MEGFIIKKREMRISSKEKYAYRATLREICDQALKQYENMSNELCHWNSVIPKAILFYGKYGNCWIIKIWKFVLKWKIKRRGHCLVEKAIVWLKEKFKSQ